MLRVISFRCPTSQRGQSSGPSGGPTLIFRVPRRPGPTLQLTGAARPVVAAPLPRPDTPVAHEPLEAGRSAEHQDAGRLAVDAKGVSDSHRDGRCSAGSELKAPLAGLHRELPVDDDVALILGVGVARRRGAAWKEKLDQRVAAADRLTGHANRCERPDEPQLLALAGGRPGWLADWPAGHVPTLTRPAG